MTVFSWQDQQPKKSGSRYTADSYEYHHADGDYRSPPFIDGYVWVPPADFNDYLDDRANRLVVVDQGRYFEVHDTRDGQVFVTSRDGFRGTTQEIYETAARSFRTQLQKNLDIDLDGATVSYWGELMLLKWNDITVKFKKPNDWSLYKGFEYVGSAENLDDLRGDHPDVPIPRSKQVIRGEDGGVLATPRELASVIMENLRPLKDGSSYNLGYSDFDHIYRKNETWDEPNIDGYAWLPPIDLEDFHSDRAARIVVHNTTLGKEVRSPRSPQVIESEDYSATVEHLYREAHNTFLSNIGSRIAVDLSDATLGFSDEFFDLQWPDASITYSLGRYGPRWELNVGGEYIDQYSDIDSLQEGVAEHMPHLLRTGSNLPT